MKFQCGRWLIEAAKRAKQAEKAAREWHAWYAWHPVKIKHCDCRWLETVERRWTATCYMALSGARGWEYRAKE